MNACNHCNFKNTSKCVQYQIQEQFDEGLITEEQMELQIQIEMQNCANEYYDSQLRKD